MLEHVLRGLVETAVVTHRRTGAVARLRVTMAGPGKGAAFTVAEALDPAYLAAPSGEWRSVQVKGDWFGYTVKYVQRTAYAGLPSFVIDAPFHQFAIAFAVDEPHPNPDYSGRSAPKKGVPSRA